MAFLGNVYISFAASVCGAERELWRRTGIRLSSAMCWNGQPKLQIQKLACGRDPGCTTDQGLWGIPSGHGDSMETQLRERLDDHPIQRCPICSRCGLSFFIVPQPMQTACHGWSGPSWSKGSLEVMTQGCGHASAGFLAQMLRTQGRVRLPASLFHWEGWACGVPHVRQATGPVGPIVCSW